MGYIEDNNGDCVAKHQVVQYLEDDNGYARIVQRGPTDTTNGIGTMKIALERKDQKEDEWEEVEILGEKRRSSHIDGNRSPPPANSY